MLSKNNESQFSNDEGESYSTGITRRAAPDHATSTKPADARRFDGAATGRDWPLLPWSRGPLSETIISALQREPGTLGPTPRVAGVDALGDDDFSLALYLCNEVHYRSAANSYWEWDPALLAFRAELERAFEDRLRDEVVTGATRFPFEVVSALDEMMASSQSSSLSAYLVETGNVHEFREFCVHRSAHWLKEADSHAFAIPRLTGEAQAAVVQIHFDEYGSGNANATHAKLFGDTLIALGLDPTYGSYVEVLPGVTLALVNLASLFALHRHWRAALVGHLAVAEMTSATAMSRYSQALARFEIDAHGRYFFDAHASDDERHTFIVRDQLIGGLLRSEPELVADLLFGAAAWLTLEDRFASHLLRAWADRRSSLVPWELSSS